MQRIYGVINNDDVLIDTLLTERGVKNFATRNGYDKIGYRVGYNAITTHKRVKNKWVKISYSEN